MIAGLLGHTARAQTAPAPVAATPPADATATPPPPLESPDARMAEARRRYAQGAEFYRRARYSEAIAELSEAYTLWENPTILYALAQAFEGRSDATHAIETYRRYLETAADDDMRRADAEAKIAELQGLLATVHVASNVSASIYVDGERVGEAPGDVRVATGRRTLEIRAEGYESQTETVTVAGGTERSVSFELQAVAVTAMRVERERFRFPRPVFYAAAGVTGAGLITWMSMASASIARANDYNDMPGSTSFDRADARLVARRSNVVLGVTGGLGAATAIIGVLTRWHDRPSDTDDPPVNVSAAVEPLVGGALVTARWTR